MASWEEIQGRYKRDGYVVDPFTGCWTAGPERRERDRARAHTEELEAEIARLYRQRQPPATGAAAEVRE